jgi:hypothetical protein
MPESGVLLSAGQKIGGEVKRRLAAEVYVSISETAARINKSALEPLTPARGR